jgi:hypothetical protein
VAPEVAASVVAGDVYQATVTVPTLFDSNTRWHRRSLVLATQWHGLSLIEEAGSAFAKAGLSALTSAWVYDDAKLVPLAKEARLRALRFFRAAQEQNQHFSADTQLEEVILADLLRRTDDFSAVMQCDQGQSTDTSEDAKRVLLFEIELASRRDARCHTVSEALDKSKRVGNLQRKPNKLVT